MRQIRMIQFMTRSFTSHIYLIWNYYRIAKFYQIFSSFNVKLVYFKKSYKYWLFSFFFGCHFRERASWVSNLSISIEGLKSYHRGTDFSCEIDIKLEIMNLWLKKKIYGPKIKCFGFELENLGPLFIGSNAQFWLVLLLQL